jgi:predicted GNAT family N-acyltransferase
MASPDLQPIGLSNAASDAENAGSHAADGHPSPKCLTGSEASNCERSVSIASTALPGDGSSNSVPLAPAPGAVCIGPSLGITSSFFADPSRKAIPVTLAFAMADTVAGQHVAATLNRVAPVVSTRAAAVFTPPADLGSNQQSILDWVEAYFRTTASTPLILISDLLKRPNDPVEGILTRECQTRFGTNPLGTVAVLRSHGRIPDIDRTVGPDVSYDDLARALILLIARLDYLDAPSDPKAIDKRSITIRPLKNDNEREYREYFRLRHRVYTQMGYLDEATERSSSKIEINEADVHAIHLGAFDRSGFRETLIGCARVATNSDADPTLQEMFETLVLRDPIARQRLHDTYPLGLPIFQTHRLMNPIITDIFRNHHQCGELSRVIVDRGHRGNGIANMLIAEALRRAVEKGLDRIFLECLKIHETLYEKHGFKRLPGVEGCVVDVNRTMIAMELQPDAMVRITAKA